MNKNENTKTSSETFTDFWATLEEDRKQAKAEQRKVAEDFITASFKSSSLQAVIAAAGNPMLPSNLQLQAASSDNWRVREAVAGNLSAPRAALEELAKDTEVAVRLAVASNGWAPSDILLELADDANWRVREAVASHALAGVDGLFEKLAQDPQAEVVKALYANSEALDWGMEWTLGNPELEDFSFTEMEGPAPF